MKSILRWLFLAGLIITSMIFLYSKNEADILLFAGILIGLLLFFTFVSLVMLTKELPMAREIYDRTATWWWMCAVFLLALSIHRLVSFLFLGFLCFSALREYFSLFPMKEKMEELTLSFKDRPSVFLCYLSIPMVIYLAYIKWYELFIIFIPVYVFLSVPIIFVLQNRTHGTLKSIGTIAIGLMLFVHNLGHCLFMINMGAIVLVYCFALTEIRDLISFWIGKSFAVLGEKIRIGWLSTILTAKVAPDVSPRKTWSTGLVSSLIISALSVAFVPYMPMMPDGKLTAGYSAIIGFLIGVTGFFGDLVFSAIKRDIGVKDSGNILPGHGGIIDRVDALVFTIPITFHLLYWKYF
jgi:phosphatidate cytidylyltransferase